MTTYIPPWLEGDRETLPAQPGQTPGRWVKGQSGNPRGRPRGIVDRRTKLAEKMLADADGIVSVMVEKALEGDSSAAHLILGRVLPALRSQSEKVQFDFDTAAPLPQQIEQVLAAIATGLIAPNVGGEIISSLGTLADARAVTDLEARIITLEAKEAHQ